MAPVIRDLGGLVVEVKNAGECRGYAGTQGFKGFGKEPIRASSLIGGLPCLSLCVVESESGPFIYSIETLKCLFDKIWHFLVCGCRGAIWMK